MENKDFSKKLEKMTREFAVRIIRLSTKLPNTPEGRVIRNQITKSGTSIGVNYRETNRARSKADFKNKIKICESKASLSNGIRSLFHAYPVVAQTSIASADLSRILPRPLVQLLVGRWR